MVSISENKASESKPILSEVANISAQTSMPRAKVTGAGKDQDHEREKQSILSKCKEISSKISKSENVGEIGELIAQLNALAASAEALGIKINVSEMIAAASAKESAMSGMAGVSGESKQDDVAREAQAREKEWDNDPRRGEWTKAKIEAAYEAFDKVNEPRLKKLRKKNAILDDAIRAIDAGEPPSEEHKEVLRPKTPEEMEQERQHKEELEKMEKIAKQDHDYHDARHKEVEEKLKELEARKQRHKDAGDHQAAAVVDKEMELHVHRKKYHVEGRLKAVAKQDRVKGTKEEYEKEERGLEKLRERAAITKDLTWGGLVVDNAAENKKMYDKPADIQDIKNEVVALRISAIPNQEQKNHDEQTPAPKLVISPDSTIPQPQIDPLLQPQKHNKDALKPDQKLDAPVPLHAEVKKQEQVIAPNLQEVAAKGASIINSAKEHAVVSKQDGGAQVKPEGGVNVKNKKPRQER